MNIKKKFNIKNAGFVDKQLAIGAAVALVGLILIATFFVVREVRRGDTPEILDPIIDPFKPSKPDDPTPPPTKPDDPKVPPPTKPELPVKPPVVEGKREAWQVIPVPGGKCGNGEQYVMGFSAGPQKLDGKTNSRLVTWMPGGGSTMITRDGEFTTNVGPGLGLITPPKQFAEETSFIFLNHPDNNLFVKDANWVILPYCTQDFHSGRLTTAKEYDFTGETDMVKAYEKQINQSKGSLEQIRNKYPFARLETHTEGGVIKIDKLYISIIHGGALNVELSLKKLFPLLEQGGFDLDRAEIIMTGSSAGGFGTWYNAWRIGDLLYKHPNATFTIIPQSGSPSTRRWNGTDIPVVSEQVADVDYRLSYYNNINPCNQIGGNYRGGGDCRDTLDLIKHYKQRWPEMDLAIMPVTNKEDLVAVAGLGEETDPGFDAKLLNLCQSIHRYSQYTAKVEDVFPYTLWQYRKTSSRGEVRVHGLTNALLTTKMVSPNDGNSDEYGILRMINDVASRKLKWKDQIPHIEYTLNVVTNPEADSSSVISRPDYLQACNVPWPSQDRPN